MCLNKPSVSPEADGFVFHGTEDAGKEDFTIKNIIRIKYDIILEKRNCL